MNREGSSIQVVGIGASAGGLDALKDFFVAMPADNGMAFVVIQHLDPAHVSYMAGLLAKHTTMAVTPAEDGVEVRANSVYTIPPNTSLFIKEGKLHLTDPIKRDGIRMPIDFFFRSLAQDQHEKAICVPAIRQRLGRNPGNKGDPWRRRYCRRPGPRDRSVRFYASERDRNGLGGFRAAAGANTRRAS